MDNEWTQDDPGHLGRLRACVKCMQVGQSPNEHFDWASSADADSEAHKAARSSEAPVAKTFVPWCDKRLTYLRQQFFLAHPYVLS